VKASITGSILGSMLLVLGLSRVEGGWKRDRQTALLSRPSLDLFAALEGCFTVGSRSGLPVLPGVPDPVGR
jgi:hypothetical protein